MRKIVFFIIPVLLLAACQPKPQEKKLSVKWISSTDSARWQKIDSTKIKLTDSTETTEFVEIFSNQLQTIDGFGACFNEKGWEILQVLPEEERNQILQHFFEPGKGHNFNICRMPIGANDYALDWYSHNDSAGDFAMENFSIERDKKYLIPYIKQAMVYNPELKIWASPWSPPEWMKTNKHYACKKAESNDLEIEGKEMQNQFVMQDEYLKAYALYFVKFVQVYRDLGINLYAVHPQNEPNSCQPFPSCIWTPSALLTFMRDYLYPAFQKHELNTEIWLGTIERPQIERLDTILQDPEVADFLEGVGFQWAGKKVIAKVNEKYPEFKLMQTESECGDGSNNWEAAEYTFGLMKHYFNSGANSYLYWNMVLDETGNSRWGWKQNSLISINRETAATTYNPEFYLFKHFSHFIRPKAKMLATSKPERNMLAFMNPNDDIVIVSVNMNETDEKINIKIGDDILQINLPAKSFNTFLIKSDEVLFSAE